MRCSAVIEKLESLAPACFAESWDNPGLLTGRFEKAVRTVMLAVDATDSVVEEAAERGADLLVTHHPLIFSPRSRINDGDFIGRRLVTLLRHDICCYVMHTNFDVAVMADAAADRIGLRDRQVLDVTYEKDGRREGIGRVGKLPSAVTLEDCGRRIRDAFALPSVKLFGDGSRPVERAAICPGAGKSVVKTAAEQGADVLITGDIDHHTGIDALAMGLCIVDAGHYGLEQIFVPYMEAYLERECGELTVLRAAEQAPFWIL